MTRGQKAADATAKFYGSWPCVIGLAVFITVYIAYNIVYLIWPSYHVFDRYPFILLNLVLGIFVLFGAPLIMMAQNRQDEKDRKQAQSDYNHDTEALRLVQNMQAGQDDMLKLLLQLTGERDSDHGT